MKRYELRVDGYHTPLTADEVAAHFGAGRLRRSDPCREAGAAHWRTVDEVFPLLKYDSSEASSLPPLFRATSRRDSTAETGDLIRPMTSALKAGWIFVGLGLCVSWFFPLGNAFFSFAIISALVAMCTHQVNRGLVLLMTSLAGIAL